MSIEFWMGALAGLLLQAILVTIYVRRTRASRPRKTYEVYMICHDGRRVVLDTGLTRFEADSLASRAKNANNVLDAFVRKEGTSRV